HTGRSAGTNWNRPDLPGPLPGKSRLDTRLVSCAASAQTAKPPGERQAPIISAGPQAKLRLTPLLGIIENELSLPGQSETKSALTPVFASGPAPLLSLQSPT